MCSMTEWIEPYLPQGYNEYQVLFSTQFFVDNPSITRFQLSLQATTFDNRVGKLPDLLCWQKYSLKS